MKTLPVVFVWTDEGQMQPLPQYRRTCDRQFVVGEQYTLEIAGERSQRSHNHYFACVHDAWMNLPAELSERFPSEETLRKYALIKAGYADLETIVCDTATDARRMALIVRKKDRFAVIRVSDNVLSIWTAKSQSSAAMGKQDFQDSKTKVLEYIADLIGTTRKALVDNAMRKA
jgi:hypothetical protein